MASSFTWRFIRKTAVLGCLTSLSTLSVLSAIGAVSAISFAKTTTIKIETYETGGRGTEKLILSYASAYEKAHPGVKIKLSISGYPEPIIQKVLTSTVAGVGPDIFISNNFTFPRLQGLLMDLTPYMKTSPLKLKSLVPASRDAFMVKGKLLMVPYTAGAEVMYMNPSLVKERGLPIPASAWTMDDFALYCSKLTTRDGNNKVKTTGAGIWGITNEGIWWLWSHGADILNKAGDTLIINSPEGKLALSKLRDLIVKGYVNGVADYNRGVVGFQYGGPWMIKQFRPKFSMQVVAMPTGPIGRKVTSVFTGGWGISSASKVKSEAWKFIEYMMTKENQIAMAPFEPPALIDATRDKRALEIHPVDYSVFVDALDYGRNFTVTRASDLVIKQLTPELDAILSGKRSFDEAIGRVVRPIETILKTTK